MDMPVYLGLRLHRTAKQLTKLRVLHYTVATSLRLPSPRTRFFLVIIVSRRALLSQSIVMHPHFLLSEAIVLVFQTSQLLLVAGRIECPEPKTIRIRCVRQLRRQSLLLAAECLKL